MHSSFSLNVLSSFARIIKAGSLSLGASANMVSGLFFRCCLLPMVVGNGKEVGKMESESESKSAYIAINIVGLELHS